MAVRFRFGRAGTGKTHACLEAIRSHLRADPIDGPQLILFLPEQAAVQAERNLLAVDDIAGASRYHTLSFRRLQQLVLKETGLADREVVGQIGRQMILQYLLIRNRRQLQVLEKVAARPGTAAKVAAGLVEFMQQGILSGQLRESAGQVETAGTPLAGVGARVPRGLLAGKLRDLALLYDEYLRWLTQRKQADPAALLAETADRLSALEWLRGALVWVDGFASFSAQQRYMLTQLAQVAGSVEIGLLMDPALVDRPQPPEPHDLFHETWQTYQQLKAGFEQANVAVEEPVLLKEEPRRFQGRPVLAHLESQLFETTRQVKPPRSRATEIEVVEAANRRVEVEAVARKIVDLTRAADKGRALRYRRIGVIVRDLEPYHDLFQTVFAAHGIPYFIDRRRGVSHHPLVELIRGLLRLLVEDWPLDAVAALLKTGLTPIPRDRADLVENYLLAHGINGWETWCRGEWKYLRRLVGADEEAVELHPAERQMLAKANYARRIICSLLRDWANPASNQRQAGREWAERLYKTLERLKVPVRLGRWRRLEEVRQSGGQGTGDNSRGQVTGDREQPTTAGDRSQVIGDSQQRQGTGERVQGAASDDKGEEGRRRREDNGGGMEHTLGQQHERVWQLLVQLLDDLVTGLGEEEMTAEQFQATIEAGLEAFSLPLIPPVVDQVVVGSVERSRQPELSAAFVLGFNEGMFPHRAGEDVLLSDHERDLVRGLDSCMDLPTGRQRLFDERMLVYIALTRASEYVWLSYAAADESGRRLAPSPYLRALEMTLPGIKKSKLGEPLAALSVGDVGTGWQAATGAVLAARKVADGRGRQQQGTGDRLHGTAGNIACDNGEGTSAGSAGVGPGALADKLPVASSDNNYGNDHGPAAAQDHGTRGGDGQARAVDVEGWGGLWGWMREQIEWEGKVRRVASACDYGNGCRVRDGQAMGLCGETLLCSVSQLQEYATCPYRYFVHYGLRLKERPEFELAAVELGSFYHRILWKVGMAVRKRGQSLRTVPLDVLNQVVSQATDEELAAVVDELALTGGREQYLLERAKADLGSAVRGHVSLWRNSQFEPALLEATFGMKGGLPALEIDTPKGRRAVLRGKIDRIDVAQVNGRPVLTVIDYKRSSRYRFRLDSAMAGLQVQLVAYMKAAEQAGAGGQFGGGATAMGGMYYFNLLPTWERVAPGEMLTTGDRGQVTGDGQEQGAGDGQEQGAAGKQWQLKGFTNTDWLGAFGDGQDGGWPMEMRLTSKGIPYANVPAGDTAALQKAVDFIWREMATTVDRIVDGDFAIHPYRMGQEVACNHCPFDGLCRFAPEFNKYREVERCGTRQLLERLGEDGGQGGTVAG